MDYAVRLISLEDDATLPIFTLRMWFLSLGLSCFGAVLGQIFVCSHPVLSTPSHHFLTACGGSTSARKLSTSASFFCKCVRPESCAWEEVLTVSLRQQIFAFILGKALEDILPGPHNARSQLRTRDNRFWRLVAARTDSNDSR